MNSHGLWLFRAVLIGLCWSFSLTALADPQEDQLLNACPAVREWRDKLEQNLGKEKAPSALTVILPQLRRQLLAWSELDQKVRAPLMKGPAAGQAAFRTAFARMHTVDEVNYRRIKDVIDQYGFPTIAMVGKDGSAAAFLLVQHQADRPEFQQFVLDIMGPLAKRGDVGREGYALLQDRVLVLGQHKPQIYGTQFKQVGDSMHMESVEDPEHLDERREEMGLMPIAAYRCLLSQMYHTAVK